VGHGISNEVAVFAPRCVYGIMQQFLNAQWLMEDLFKAVCNFYLPHQLLLLSNMFTDFQSVLNTLNAVGKWQLYLDLATKQKQTDDVDTFWHAVEYGLPKLALP